MQGSSTIDISTHDDIKVFCDSFYEKLLTEPATNSLFTHLDMPHHMPKIYSFWQTILMGEITYRDNAMAKHLNLPLEKIHFTHWLRLFEESIREHFEGPIAEMAIERAKSVRVIMQVKMGLA